MSTRQGAFFSYYEARSLGFTQVIGSLRKTTAFRGPVKFHFFYRAGDSKLKALKFMTRENVVADVLVK